MGVEGRCSPEEGRGGHRLFMDRQEDRPLPGREHLDSERDVSEASPGRLEGKGGEWQAGDRTHACSPRRERVLPAAGLRRAGCGTRKPAPAAGSLPFRGAVITQPEI